MARDESETAWIDEPEPGRDSTERDPTGVSDIRYYRDTVPARLSAQAAEKARRARRDAVVLIPLAAGVVVLWSQREDLFGTDVPIRIAAAILLAAIGWRFARDLGRALGPRLLARFEPGTASTIGFLVQIVTLIVVVIVALRLVDVDPGTLALGGAFTAVILGLAAQSTLGNLIAGTVLLAARPFRVGDRVRMQGGSLGAEMEGTVASLGLLYTTLARGDQKILVPNNAALGATIMPLRRPAGVDLRARLASDVRPSELQRRLRERVRVPTRDDPEITLEEVDGNEVIVKVSAIPVNDADGGKLADEILAVVTEMTAKSAAE